MCDGGQTNEGNGQTAEARKIPPCRVMDKYINAQNANTKTTTNVMNLGGNFSGVKMKLFCI